MNATTAVEAVTIPVGADRIHGDLRVPASPNGLVIVARGSGSSRFSARNRHVADMLDHEGFATLLLDLLTRAEETVDVYTSKYRFEVERLGHRVSAVVDWAAQRPDLGELAVGGFAASTGAAAALIAAAARPASVAAIVSRTGRLDLAGDALPRVQAPTLLIVGARDTEAIELNCVAMRQMRAPVQLEIVPGATHFFEEPGTLDQAARLAAGWFRRYLGSARSAPVPPAEWATFLARFSRRHRAWLTTVERLAPGESARVDALSQPLDAVVPLEAAGRVAAFEIRFQGATAPACLPVPDPAIVRVSATAAGAERGIDIESDNGVLRRLRFRATVRAEELDALAPAEV